MLRTVRQDLRRYREVILAVTFLGIASYELFEFWVLELPGGPRLPLAVLVHSFQVAVILGGTGLVLRAWQEKTAREETLARLVEKVIGAQEEERRRIAYDIHDGLAQLIVSAKQHIDTCEDLWGRDTLRAARELATGLDRLQRAIVETRRVLLELRPFALDTVGLVGAAQDLLREAAREGGWSVRFRENLRDVRLSSAVETAVFRILQEAVVNVLRHARTPSVEVVLHHGGGWLGLDVQDQGVGFSPADRPASRGLGLESMRERARLLGGTCAIESAPNSGSRISVRLPLGNGHRGG
jgi:signal transduction histidine kinase